MKTKIMKQVTSTILFIIAITFSSYGQGNAGIGTLAPHPSAKLEIASTTQGLLIPRMTTLQRNAIANPATGLLIFNLDTNCINFYHANGSWIESCGVEHVPVVKGKWMVHNLGASRVAKSKTDTEGYGDLYQWGRGSDGHQLRTSAITTVLSDKDVPGHNLFIHNTSAKPIDWRSVKNDQLWQGGNGINNPCPSGFRIPTISELTEEMNSWNSNNLDGAFNSDLKFPGSGIRPYSDPVLSYEGSYSSVWSSTTISSSVHYLVMGSTNASVENFSFRTPGFSVRCIKDQA